MSKINEKFDEIHCILSLDRHDRIKNVHLVEANGLKPADFHFKEMFLEEKIKIYRMLTYFVTPMLDSYILGNND